MDQEKYTPQKFTEQSRSAIYSAYLDSVASLHYGDSKFIRLMGISLFDNLQEEGVYNLQTIYDCINNKPFIEENFYLFKNHLLVINDQEVVCNKITDNINFSSFYIAKQALKEQRELNELSPEFLDKFEQELNSSINKFELTTELILLSNLVLLNDSTKPIEHLMFNESGHYLFENPLLNYLLKDTPYHNNLPEFQDVLLYEHKNDLVKNTFAYLEQFFKLATEQYQQVFQSTELSKTNSLMSKEFLDLCKPSKEHQLGLINALNKFAIEHPKYQNSILTKSKENQQMTR